MHPRREALCGSVRRFPVLGGNFSRGAGRAAYKGVQRAEMLRNVEAFKKHKKLLLIFEQQDFWTILSEKFFRFFGKIKKQTLPPALVVCIYIIIVA